MRPVLCTGAVLLLALASVGAAGPAAAETLPDGASRATLVNPTAAPAEAIIDGRIWRCEGQTCAADANDSAQPQPLTRECHRSAIWLGRFTAYQTGPKVLSPSELAECNAKVTTTSPRSPS